jgi:hypothetical protein
LTLAVQIIDPGLCRRPGTCRIIYQKAFLLCGRGKKENGKTAKFVTIGALSTDEAIALHHFYQDSSCEIIIIRGYYLVVATLTTTELPGSS